MQFVRIFRILERLRGFYNYQKDSKLLKEEDKKYKFKTRGSFMVGLTSLVVEESILDILYYKEYINSVNKWNLYTTNKDNYFLIILIKIY